MDIDPEIFVVFGSIISIVFIVMLGIVITAWINRDSSKKLTQNPEFLDALRDFKENMERRMSNLEEIVSEERSDSSSLSTKVEKKNTQRAIELEFDDESREERKAEETAKLRNMLNQ